MTTSTTSIDIMCLQAAYANLHTDQELDYFMQRYHDVISPYGGKTSYDADNRPALLMSSNPSPSGHEVAGTDRPDGGLFPVALGGRERHLLHVLDPDRASSHAAHPRPARGWGGESDARPRSRDGGEAVGSGAARHNRFETRPVSEG